MSTQIIPNISTSIVFSKKFSTAKLYKRYIDEGKTKVEAIKKSSYAFDVFGNETKNVNYLIERHAELYNHKKVINSVSVQLDYNIIFGGI